jgi:hypothetical protein
MATHLGDERPLTAPSKSPSRQGTPMPPSRHSTPKPSTPRKEGMPMPRKVSVDLNSRYQSGVVGPLPQENL